MSIVRKCRLVGPAQSRPWAVGLRVRLSGHAAGQRRGGAGPELEHVGVRRVLGQRLLLAILDLVVHLGDTRVDHDDAHYLCNTQEQRLIFSA